MKAQKLNQSLIFQEHNTQRRVTKFFVALHEFHILSKAYVSYCELESVQFPVMDRVMTFFSETETLAKTEVTRRETSQTFRIWSRQDETET